VLHGGGSNRSLGLPLGTTLVGPTSGWRGDDAVSWARHCPTTTGEIDDVFTSMRALNFKSWRDTGDLDLRPITGFFGSNSSGKTSLLQLLLLLKQTAASADRRQVL